MNHPPARSSQTPDPRRALGAAGEEMAARALLQAGLHILDRNWRCTGVSLPGEIDLIAEEVAPDYVQGGEPTPWRVFVEVRTRRGESHGTALESVTEAKARRLRALGAAWVQEHDWRGPWRIDVVAIQMDTRGRLLQIEHLRHAVSGE